jgi:cell division transport system permease protein
MQLVGATRGFIRRPFLFRSAVSGFTGSIIALSIMAGIIYFMQEEFEGILTFRDFDLLALLGLAVIFVGIIISWISTFFAVNKYLRIETDKLY